MTKFPEHFPVFPSRLQVAEYLNSYAALLGHEHIRYNFAVKSADFDQSAKIWTVIAESLTTNEQITYKVPHLVIATGENAASKIPKFAGQEKFQGKIVHSEK